MPRLELTRSAEDKKLYVLPGVGELRVGRWPSRDVEATAGGRTYTFAPRGSTRRVPTATDVFGTAVGRQDGSWSIVWRSATWDLRPAVENAVAYYALARPEDQQELARLVLALWGKRPVPIVFDDSARLDPGLLLFAMFVMRLTADGMNRSPGGGEGPAGV
jgi:hypothetical protein